MENFTGSVLNGRDVKQNERGYNSLDQRKNEPTQTYSYQISQWAESSYSFKLV